MEETNMKIYNLSNAKVYVGTYGKYNNGSLFGAWLDLPEFAKTYFDYEKFARDLFMCDYCFDDGFVFMR